MLPTMISGKVKAYFEPNTIMSMLDRRERRSLSRSGAYVAQVARRSIYKKRGASAPGRPPYSHTGKLRQMIGSGVDSNKVCAVAGALVRLDVKNQGRTPNVLEHGGVTTVTSKPNRYKIGSYAPIAKEKVAGSKGVRYAKIKSSKQIERAEVVARSGIEEHKAYINARPFMSSALIQSEKRINMFFKE